MLLLSCYFRGGAGTRRARFDVALHVVLFQLYRTGLPVLLLCCTTAKVQLYCVPVSHNVDHAFDFPINVLIGNGDKNDNNDINNSTSYVPSLSTADTCVGSSCLFMHSFLGTVQY